MEAALKSELKTEIIRIVRFNDSNRSNERQNWRS